MNLDQFTQGYIDCALWSSLVDDVPMDEDYGIEDISPGTLKDMIEDCRLFQKDNSEMWEDDCQAGHDFWLTRNGHGSGYWDGDYETGAGKMLTKASKDWGSYDLYVGGDGKIYN